ncbi:MAG: hypothetical protein IH946_05760 [Bacteroidetes bacterium]|nr:hypothetical protein [Bacteroidota bacterium]
MKINENNYEEYFFDFVEGNLSPSQQKELTAFLENYPELNAELSTWQNTILQPDESIIFKISVHKRKNL